MSYRVAERIDLGKKTKVIQPEISKTGFAAASAPVGIASVKRPVMTTNNMTM